RRPQHGEFLAPAQNVTHRPSPVSLPFLQAGFCRDRCRLARQIAGTVRRSARCPVALELPNLRKSHQIAHALKSVAVGGGQGSGVAVLAQMSIDTLERSGGSKKAYSRIDRDGKAEGGQPRCRQNWGTTAFNHVREERCIDLLTNARELVLGLRALHEHDIGAGTRVELAAAYRFVQPERGARVGAGD